MNSKLLICRMKYGLWHRSCSVLQSKGLESRVITKRGDLIAATDRADG